MAEVKSDIQIARAANKKPIMEIGDKLGIAESTAHFYVEKAKRKLGAKTRTQAVARLIAAGLL